MSDEIRNLYEEQPKQKKTVSFQAIISFIAGLGTYIWLFAMIGQKFVLSMVVAPVIAMIAIFTGHRAKKQIRKSEGTIKGKKIANVGLFLGYLFIAIGVLILVLALVIGGSIISMISGWF